MQRRLPWIAALALLLALPAVWATTWGATDATCPVCKAQVTVDVPASFGSYIYRWPSRLQLLFWPTTETMALHYCDACHFAAFLGDFEKLPADQAAPLKPQLAALEAPAGKPGSGSWTRHWFAAAELVYSAWGKDDQFWSLFHRAAGYHLSAAGETAAAKQARTRALTVAEKLLAGKPKAADEKELRLVVASMQYLIGKPAAAKRSAAKARAIVVPAGDGLDEQQAQNTNEYLNEVIDQLVGHIEKGEPLPQ